MSPFVMDASGLTASRSRNRFPTKRPPLVTRKNSSLQKTAKATWKPSPVEYGQSDCELPGYFCCGVPGILAHVEKGRVAPGAKVERCDLCRRYASDQVAYEKLVELGMV